MNRMFTHEVADTAAQVASLKAMPHGVNRRSYKNFCIYGENNKLCDFTVNVLGLLLRQEKIDDFCLLDTGGVDDNTAAFVKACGGRVVSADESFCDTAFLIFADTLRCSDSARLLQSVNKAVSAAAKGTGNACVLAAMLPEAGSIPDGVTRLAEREYSYYIENRLQEKNEGVKLYIELEKLFRGIVRDGFEAVNIVRFDNVFGAQADMMRDCDLEGMIRKAFADGYVEITETDGQKKFSCVYIRDAVKGIFGILKNGRIGHVYNCGIYSATPALIKRHLHSRFSDKLGFRGKVSAVEQYDNRCFSMLKYKRAGNRKELTLSQAVYREACAVMGIPYDTEKNMIFFNGKLARIKKIKTDMLKVIDEICRENSIKYFVYGNTLRAAVTKGESFEWDEQLQIAMLRRDFEKFRKIAPASLGEKYHYGCWINDKDCHFYIDKLRLANTFYSTKFSRNFLLHDGVYADIHVLDKTPKNKLLHKLHLKLTLIFQQAVNVRWYNKARRRKAYVGTRILLPLMRVLPFGFFHRMHDFVLGFYRKSGAKSVIDATGPKLFDGVMPIECFKRAEYVDFGGISVPVPADSEPVLRFLFNGNYNIEPNLSVRVKPRSLSRIDLGEFLFEDKPYCEFRKVDIRGELYEEETVELEPMIYSSRDTTESAV